MKGSDVNKKLRIALFGLLALGGAAALFEIYRSTKNIENSCDDTADAVPRYCFV